MLGGTIKSFDPDKDIGDLQGKVVLVTGGNNGLGKETVLRLAKHTPDAIFLCSRSQEKGEAAITEIKKTTPKANIKCLKLDLSSFASVKETVSAFQTQSNRLDILVNNAGIMAVPEGKTADGYEIQFGTNHLGHALLTKLLMPSLLKTAEEPEADVRIINLSSAASYRAPPPGINFDDIDLKSGSPYARYGQSKLANILFTHVLAKQYPQVTSVAIHPGVVRTNLFDTMMNGNRVLGALSFVFGKLVYLTVENGTKNQLWAATTAKANLESGGFYYPVGVRNPGSNFARDEELDQRLWDWTEAELKKHGY